MILDSRLLATTDAVLWAEEFLRVVDEPVLNGAPLATDVDLMVGWFANAIETARAQASRQLVGELTCLREIARLLIATDPPEFAQAYRLARAWREEWAEVAGRGD